MSSIIWRVEHFTEVDSTNAYVRTRVDDGLTEGYVALADYQTAGRGRLDRRWDSPARASLLCSMLLTPPIAADEFQLVVAVVALSTRAAIERLSGLRAELKWPNDLVVGANKLAGLLAEVVESSSGTAVVVGLGVNLTHEGPEGTAATSVRAETGLTLEPISLLDLVLEEIDTRIDRLAGAEGRDSLRAEYERALATIGEDVRVELVRGTLFGRARGVDDAGQLLVDVDGTLEVVSAGDVVHLRAGESARS